MEEAVLRFRELVISASGWKRLAWAFGAGMLSVLAMSPFYLSPILFLTFPVFVWLIDRPVAGDEWGLSAARSAAVVGWWFGFGYFLAGLFWIGEAFLVEAEKYAYLIPFAVTLLPFGLAFFFAAAAGLARLFWRPGFARVIALAIALTVFEWLRGHIFTGFPWNLLGYALTWPLPLMQIASIFGVYGLTPLAVGIASAPLVVAADYRARAPGGAGAWHGIFAAAATILAIITFGLLRLSAPPAPNADGVKLRIVQPSIAQREKWIPANQGRIFKEHLDLSQRNSHGERDSLTGITHVVWSEAAMPFLPLEHPEAIAAIAETLPPGSHLLAGGLRLAKEEQGNGRHVFNSLIAFDSEGTAAAIYDKNHLVPFGEYLPFSQWFRLIGLRGLVEMRGAFESGPEPRPLLSAPGLPPVGALICYEAIFPGDVVQGRERPAFLLSVTNDGWFGNTTGPRQHFHQARVRAVEEGLPLVRAANNGISAVVDAEGRIMNKLDLNVRGTIDAPLPGARSPTHYARWGDWIVFFELSFLVGLLVLSNVRALPK
jgi:apolipoprotein N-acyltransferase